jgi:protein-disulfide isomerase
MNKSTVKRRLVAFATLAAFVTGIGMPGVSLAAGVSSQSPKGILMEMSKRFADAKSVNYSVDVDFNKETPDNRMQIVMFGSVEQDTERGVNRSSISVLPKFFEDEEIPQNLMFDLVADSSNLYFKASGLPKDFLEKEKQIGKYADTWVRYNENTVNYILGEFVSSTDDTMAAEIFRAQFNRLKTLQADPARVAYQKEQYRKISDALFKRNAVTVTRLADVRIDANDKTSPYAYRLKISINKWGFGQFLKDFSKIMSEDPAYKSEFGGRGMFEMLSEEFIRESGSLKLPTMEVVIGKNDYLPRKMTISFYKQNSKKNEVQGTITVSMDGFNAARPVTVPGEFKKLEDILKDEKVFETMRAERERNRAMWENWEDEDVILSTSTTSTAPSVNVGSSTVSAISYTEYVRGNNAAPVTIEEYADFECPFCAQTQASLNSLMKNYGANIRIVFKQFPLISLHPNAQKAAEASECAGEQGKFWEMHDLIFANQQQLSEVQLKSWATNNLKLDENKFNSCLDSGKYVGKIKADIAEGVRRGVDGTPTIFINGEKMVGAQVTEAYQQVIDKALKK